MRHLGLLCAFLVVAGGTLPAARPAHAWAHSPKVNQPLTTASTFAVSNLCASDGAGGAFLAWADGGHPGGNANDVYVQHIDAAGNELWTPGGVLVCNATQNQYPVTLVSDGSGGIIVGWLDNRTPASLTDLYCRRVSAAGVPQWTANGVALCNAIDNQNNLQSAADGTGGAYFSWDDSRNSGTTSTDVYVQHVNASGSVTMAVDGLALSTVTNFQRNTQLAVDDNGFCAVFWEDARSGTTDIYGQRVSSAGAISWTAGGAPICNAVGGQNQPYVAAAPVGRFVVVWTDGRGADFDVYAQTVESNGTTLLTANGYPVSTLTGPQYCQGVADDGAGGFVVLVNDRRTLADYLVAQKVDVAGNLLWTAAGVAIRSLAGNANGARITADGFGGTLVSWYDSRVDAADIYAARLNASGSRLWQLNGVPVGNRTGTQAFQNACALGTGGVLVTWDDFSGATNGSAMQAVDEWGYLGANPTLVDARDVPNDQGGQVALTWLASPLDTDPLFRNVTDYVVYRSAPLSLAARLRTAAAGPDGAIVLPGVGRFRSIQTGVTTNYWQEIAHETPRHIDTYSLVVPTSADSVAGSNPLTAFMVEATAVSGLDYWFSNPDSTYSVDNRSPAAPAPFTGTYVAGATTLHWGPNAETDLAGYRLYRGPNPAFVPSPGNRIATPTATDWVDAPGSPWIYKVTAVDVHGNESPASTVIPAGVLDVPAARAASFFLARPLPNPAGGTANATVRFGLATASRAELAVWDAAGRRVRTLASGTLEAGDHVSTWDGRDDAGHVTAPGLYFVRLVAGANVARERIVRVE